MVIKPKTVPVMAICAFLFAAGCYLLAFGGAVLCCASGHLGEGYWQPEKLVYGLLPMGVSIAVFAVTTRLWARTYVRRRKAWLIGSVVAVFVLVGDFNLFLWYRGRPEEINLVWEVESGVFSWGSGEVKLPAGFTYEAGRGIDTFVGHFTSQDGRLVIRHDIGELAGEHGGTGNFTETLTEGSRVRLARGKASDGKGGTTIFSAVSFPDSGCATFYLESSNEEDSAAVDFIARSFRPKGWTPSWMLPLFPQILRSDCRYRFRLVSEQRQILPGFGPDLRADSDTWVSGRIEELEAALRAAILHTAGWSMSSLKHIEVQIESLSPEELTAFREWFAEFDAEVWDRQFASDVEAGKLDGLAARALSDAAAGRSTEL